MTVEQWSSSTLIKLIPNKLNASSSKLAKRLRNAAPRGTSEMARICRVHIASEPGSPYSPAAAHRTSAMDRESHSNYEDRTWRNKCSVNAAGQVVIPAAALKQAIKSAAMQLGANEMARRI